MIQKFEFNEMDLKGAYIIKPFYATDERGGLIKDYNIDSYRDAGIEYDLKETFYTISKRGVIRAIHFQLERPQPKLMRCVSGRVFYVIVDLRPESDTFGQYRTMELSGEEPVCVLCPAGFGQGYLVIEDAIMSYKAAEVFYGPGDAGIMYNDSKIGIEWPFEMIGGKDNMIISDKDLKLMSFDNFKANQIA
jgi:dTDP-4-dehydrorhamnose 3,5-epimerase